MKAIFTPTLVALLLVGLCLPDSVFSQSQSREQRSRRLIRVVAMKQIDVKSPDGKVTFSLLPNAERLTFTIKLDETTVLDPSPMIMKIDGYDLSSGVVFDTVVSYKI